jgi:glycosyltransferase involved in cell wall biosynthesis
LVLTDTERIADWDSELDSYRREILKLIDEVGLEDVQLRRVPYSQMPDLYREADIVVYPTILDEPFGLVPLEAMSCGIPVVGSNCGGIAETVVHGETGFIIPPDDVGALADRLSQLLENPAQRRSLGEAARRHVLRRFDLRNYARALERIYRSERARGPRGSNRTSPIW